MTFSDEITSLALELARSLWAELGISGSPCRHDWQAVDLEPLILFTASLVGADRAFVNRTVHWCAVNSPYLSALRMRHLARRFGTATESFKGFVRAGLPGGAIEGPGLVPVETPDLKRPALVQLRLRALMGVGPRAEALRLLLAEPETARNAKALAYDAGYGANSMSLALHALTATGIVELEADDGVRLYRLARPAELAVAINGVPVAFPDWISVLAVIAAIRTYAAATEREPTRRTAAAKAFVEGQRNHLDHLGVTAQVPAIVGESSASALESWATSFVSEQSGATRRAAAHESSYSVHRLALGGWIATVTIAGGQPRPLASSAEPLLRPERRSRRRPKDDPIAEAAAVVEMMMRDFLTMTLQRRIGSTVSRRVASEPDVHGLSRHFATELLLPMHAGQAATFSERFLQNWVANHRRWHGLSA